MLSQHRQGTEGNKLMVEVVVVVVLSTITMKSSRHAEHITCIVVEY